MALDDVSPENGGLAFIPGSHKVIREKDDPYAGIPIGKNMNMVFQAHPETESMNATFLTMKSGDVSFHNGMLIHGAMPNMTPDRRRVMTCGLMPDGATFNGKANIYSKEQLAKYKVGDPLNRDVDNPLLWKRGHTGTSFPEGLPFLPPNG